MSAHISFISIAIVDELDKCFISPPTTASGIQLSRAPPKLFFLDNYQVELGSFAGIEDKIAGHSSPACAHMRSKAAPQGLRF